MLDMDDICKELLPELEGMSAEKNRVSINEFISFKPLFLVDGRKLVGEDEYFALCILWRDRVSLFDKVVVYDPLHEGVSGSDVVLVLPPMFSKINDLSIADNDLSRITDIFTSALIRSAVHTTEMPEALSLMVDAVNIAQNTTLDRSVSMVEEYHDIMEELKSSVLGNGETVEVVTKPVSTNNFVWE